MSYRVFVTGRDVFKGESIDELTKWLQGQSLNDAPWRVCFDLPDDFDFKVVELQGERGNPQTLIITHDGQTSVLKCDTGKHDGDVDVSWDPNALPGYSYGFMSINLLFWENPNECSKGVVWISRDRDERPFAYIEVQADGVAVVDQLIDAAEDAIRSQFIEVAQKQVLA